jgi:3-oxoadipate enol-lactonase
MDQVHLASSTISYSRLGKGMPLVLLHGFPLDHRIWEDIAPRLTSQFDLILPDLRGLGRSTSNKAGYSVLDMAGDIADLMNHLGLKKVVLAGHSMGGYVTLAFAHSFPDKLLGFGLISSQAVADTAERKVSRYASVEQVEMGGVGVIAESMKGKLTSNHRLQEQLYHVMAQQPKAGVIDSLKAMAERPDNTDVVRRLRGPVLVVHGAVDQLIPIDRAKEANALARNSKLVILPGVGHMPMMEAPVKCVEALRWFLEFLD